jgi:Domain of unknown function (DUF4328)
VFCSRCNTMISPDADFCHGCGQAQTAAARPDPSPPLVPSAPPPLPVPPGRSGPPPSPYAPTPDVPAPPSPGAPGAPRYRSLHGLGVALTWLLVVDAVLALGWAGAFVYRRSLVDRAGGTDRPSLADLRDADRFVAAVGGWAVIASITITVILIVFLWRAAKNTELWTDAKARWSPGWTIGAWFIPLANLVLPGIVTADVWRRTPQRTLEGRDQRVPAAPVGWWWATFIASIVIVRIGTAMTDGSTVLTDYSRGDLVRAVGAVGSAVAALLLLRVVRRLTRRQTWLAVVMARPVAPVGPPPSPSFAGRFPV